MPWIEVGSTDIYYQEDGDPNAQPLVFLHGNTSCGEAWWQQFEHFRDRFHVFAYDSVNHGHSSNSPRDEVEPDRADELQGFLEAMGIRRPVLAGNSMGGNTIIRWTAKHPDDAAAIVPSGSGIAAEAPADGGAGLREARPLDPDVLFLPIGDSLTDGFKQAHPRMHERYLRIRSTATRLEAMRHPRRRAATMPRDELIARMRNVKCPTLCVVGGLDRAVASSKNLSTIVPGAEYFEIEGAPHNVYYEAARQYNAGLDDFFARKLGIPARAAAAAR
jgi:pimeloyl-ACP methyl ester carboxylesterase